MPLKFKSSGSQLQSSSYFIFCIFGELWLKRGNKKKFIAVLNKNIRKVTGADSVVYNDTIKLVYTADAYEKLKYIFGLEGVGKGVEVTKNVDTIVNSAYNVSKEFNEVEVAVSRNDKSFSPKSPELTELIRKKLRENNIIVKTKANTRLIVKIGEKMCRIYTVPLRYVYGHKFMNGAGGLPIGVTGKVGVMLSGGIDSPVAAWMMMKRGCTPVFIHFHSVKDFNPFKNEGKKIGAILNQLKKYSSERPIKLYAINAHNITAQIVQNVPDKDRLLVYRRYMLRMSQGILKREKAKAFVTGDSLSQVASQTLVNVSVITDATKYPILRPLIGMDKKEIVALAKHIGTFDYSIEKYYDTCTKLMPKHPNLCAKINEMKKYDTIIGAIETSETIDTIKASDTIKTTDTIDTNKIIKTDFQKYIIT